MNTKQLSTTQQEEILKSLQQRFSKNLQRHRNIDWATVEARLKAAPEKLWSLEQMDLTGGEPDVVGISDSGEILFFDCAAESPKGRRSLCYDREGLEARKEFKPENTAVDMANEFGAE